MSRIMKLLDSITCAYPALTIEDGYFVVGDVRRAVESVPNPMRKALLMQVDTKPSYFLFSLRSLLSRFYPIRRSEEYQNLIPYINRFTYEHGVFFPHIYRLINAGKAEMTPNYIACVRGELGCICAIILKRDAYVISAPTFEPLLVGEQEFPIPECLRLLRRCGRELSRCPMWWLRISGYRIHSEVVGDVSFWSRKANLYRQGYSSLTLTPEAYSYLLEAVNLMLMEVRTLRGDDILKRVWGTRVSNI